MNATKTTTSPLITTLQNIRDHAAKIEAEARAERIEAERGLKLARGTRDLGARAAEAKKLASYHVGDEGPTPELSDAVRRALVDATDGLTLQEIVELTGARRNRISGVIVKLQVAGHKVVNLGSGQVAKWSIKTRRPTR